MTIIEIVQFVHDLAIGVGMGSFVGWSLTLGEEANILHHAAWGIMVGCIIVAVGSYGFIYAAGHTL